MKLRLISLLFAICVSVQAQGPSGFFAMTGQLSGTSSSYTVQFPEQTITGIDTNFSTSPVGVLGHPPTLAWGWGEYARGRYDWTVMEPELAEANSQGVKMILTLGWTPQWAANTSGTGS